MTPSVLPDSRLEHDQTLGSVMADWPLEDGSTVRLEMVQVFCINCGKPYGYVPRDNTTFACWLCDPCFERYGPPPGTYATPDEEFRRKVAHEVEAQYGRPLSAEELKIEADNNRLSAALQLLLRESPYKEFRRGA